MPRLSGCGTAIKDYGYIFREDPELAEKAARVSALAKDVSELLAEAGRRKRRAQRRHVADGVIQ